jgi:tyrosyl-tRNA synthetase
MAIPLRSRSELRGTRMDKITELLTRGVDAIYPSREALEKVLRSGKKLKLYQGFDPTGTQLHIGHMVGFRKLRHWQDLGHEVIFLIGDGTGQAGDPSGKLKAREKFFTNEELRTNAKDYVMQASKIVRFEGENAIKIMYNGDWLNKLGLADMLDILGHLSLQQLLERDMFQERLKRNETVNMREFIYPLLQGYDSVAMGVDLELGGSDQMFNMLVGRQLVKDYLNKEKFVMTTPLLADSEGRKIGKSEGNVIGLTDAPSDLFGKIMGLSDDVILQCLEVLTDVSLEEINTIKKNIEQGENPMNAKKRLAFDIVKQLNSENDATAAQEHFERTVQKKELPSKISEVKITGNEPMKLEQLVFETGMVGSKSEAKRVIEQGGVEVEGKRITDPNAMITPQNDMVIRAGKRKNIRIKTS